MQSSCKHEKIHGCANPRLHDPPTFYYAVWEEYAAAELYRKEVAKGGERLLGEYFRDIDERGYCSADQYEGDDLFDSCITYRDADLVLAIN